MSAVVNALNASIDGREIGVLREEGGLWSFEYDASWLNDSEAFDLAPNLPRDKGKIIDGGTQRPVQWFFDNLLPEEAARELLAREAQIPAANAFGLLAYYGRESAGAIILLPPGESAAPGGYLPLSDEELHGRIAGLPRHSLSAGAPKRMSLAGAQHKLAVCLRDGRLFHPVGDTPSTHILKPDHKDTDFYPQSVVNEYFCMRLADKMGIPIPAVEMRHVPDPIYLIERFDRHTVHEQTRRLHTADACQLLGFDRSLKYRQANWETLTRCLDLCQKKAQARQSILAWALFNIMIGNGDAHLKNISFLIDRTGIRLAPFYDLVSTESYRAEIGNLPRWPDIPLTMPIGDATTFAAVNRENFSRFATQLGATSNTAERLVDQFRSKLPSVAANLYEEFEQRPTPTGIQRAAELRMLRIIRFASIGEMTQRLSR